MRFGTGETNITNLALPPTESPKNKKFDFAHPGDKRYLHDVIEYENEFSPQAAHYIMEANILFPGWFDMSLPENQARWEQWLIRVEGLKVGGASKEEAYFYWDTFIEFLGLLKMCDPEKARQISVSEDNWASVRGRLIENYREHGKRPHYLKYARHALIFAPERVHEFPFDENDWKSTLNEINRLKTNTFNQPRENWRNIAQMLADLKILFPGKNNAPELRLSDQDRERLKDFLDSFSRTEPEIYFEMLANLAIICSARTEITPHGLVLHESETSEQQDVAPPSQRNF